MTRLPRPATELRESMMAVTRQMRRHRPDNGLTLSQMQLLGEISRTGVTTPAELGALLHVRVQSLTDSINELVSRELIARRPDDTDRRRQLVEITAGGRRPARGRPRRTRRLAARHHARQPLDAGVRPADAGGAGPAQAGRRGLGALRPVCALDSPLVGCSDGRVGSGGGRVDRSRPDPDTAAELAACSEDELAGAVRPAADVRHGGSSRPAAWRAQRDEPRRRACVPPGRSPRCSRTAAWPGPRSWSAATPGTAPRSSRRAAAEVFAAQGFSVTLMFAAVPTPVVAFAVRQHRRGRRHPDHRVAQPAVRQRLQGLLRRRRADRLARPTGRSRAPSRRPRTPTRSPGRPSNPPASRQVQRLRRSRRRTSGAPTAPHGWR